MQMFCVSRVHTLVAKTILSISCRRGMSLCAELKLLMVWHTLALAHGYMDTWIDGCEGGWRDGYGCIAYVHVNVNVYTSCMHANARGDGGMVMDVSHMYM